MSRFSKICLVTSVTFVLILASSARASEYSNDEIIVIAKDLGKKIEMLEE